MTLIIGHPNVVFSINDWLNAGNGSPSNVEIHGFNKIGDSVWYSISGIVSVIFGPGVKEIIGHTFYNCPNLTSVHIGSDVNKIDQGFAILCKSLTTITVDPSNQFFHVDNMGILYKKDGGNDTHTMLQYPFGRGRILTIPPSVKHIAPYFAYGSTSADSLTNVVFLKDSVETIGSYAFANNDFSSIEVPNSITSIASTAFHRCYNLVTVFILQTTADMLSANGNAVVVPSTDTFRGTTQQLSIELIYTPSCFPVGTPVLTDEGIINIEKLSSKHRIQGSSIVKITRSTGHRYIINIPKNSLCLNVPSRDTKCSLEHKIFYRGVMIKARDLVNRCAPVRKVSHDGTALYNVLLDHHGVMNVNNMICETLHPHRTSAHAHGRTQPQKKLNRNTTC